jgi:methenyltetrahydrofolate cyclohydrolase
MGYKDETLKKYLDELASRQPTPGGGSAAALNAAMAAALVSMVVQFSLGKPRYAAYAEALKKIMVISEKLRDEFLRLVDLDVAAFKSKNIRDCLDVPLMVCRLAYEGIRLCPALIKKGNIHLISDVAVAAIFFESAFVSASFNVEINLKELNDDRFARGVRKELAHKGRLIKKARLLSEEKIGKIIRG